MDVKTIEQAPGSKKLRDQFNEYWARNIGKLVAWNGEGEAPDLHLALLHMRIWKLYLIAATQEGSVDEL